MTSVGGQGIVHDTDGARISGNGYAFQYDALGRLRLITDAAGSTVAIDFDAFGRPAQVNNQGALERRRYIGPLALQLEDGAAQLTAFLTRHPQMLSPSQIVKGPGALHLHFNGHEDLTLVTDSTGAPAERYAYDDFGLAIIYDGAGGVIRPSSAIGLTPMFGAMPGLGMADIYLTTKRPYDPRTGMFLCRDPFFFFSSPSPYVFANHDPINGIDPDGDIAPLLVAGLVVGAIGAIIGAASVVIRGGDYDAWDVIAAAGIGFGAGFITGVTFGAVSTALGGAALTGAAGAAATGAAASGGISVGTGIAAGAVSGLAGGTFSGFANASYQWARHGGDYASMVGEGILVEGLSGLVGGAVGGGLFAGAARLGVLPRGAWASLTGQSSRYTLSSLTPQLLARGLVSPYGLGAGAIGFGSGYSGGVVRHLLQGESPGDAFGDAVTDGYWGAGGSLVGAALHPTTWTYWRSRFSPTFSARIEQIRGMGAHHQRNVAQYPEFATPDLNRTDLTWFERFYGTNIIGGNLQGRFSEYTTRQQHIDLHNVWRFGQGGSWTNVVTHGPWTPAWPIYYPPVDPRATNHTDKSER